MVFTSFPHLVRNSQAGVYRGIKNKDTLTKKRMTVIETLSEMKAEGQTIDKTSTIDTFSTHNDVIVRPDRTSFVQYSVLTTLHQLGYALDKLGSASDPDLTLAA